ncbi:MAG: nucleoside triphosphate pyrophosphohydrolase [Chloroflexi bacterium]|nr:nucleoside triphosphate pyrophosphohydrolase [Chloroflexota bacterium]
MTPNNDLKSFDSLVQILARLRGNPGCPWDKEQTHASLRRYLLEECYEALEAIEQEDMKRLAEELGDILFQVAFHGRIAQEQGEFTLKEVIQILNEKLIRRHPHVFGDVKVANAREVEVNWEAIKRQERDRSDMSLLDGVPKIMPALAYSQAIQDRASHSGFDWNTIEGVLEKVAEEIDELKMASSQDEREAELGDVLFALVNSGRWLAIDAESALRRANERFFRRFTYMERLCRQRGVSFPSLALEEKEALWGEAKVWERSNKEL